MLGERDIQMMKENITLLPNEIKNELRQLKMH